MVVRDWGMDGGFGDLYDMFEGLFYLGELI